ncbi:MAG: hypothetical protein GXY32_01080 [Ruminococcaceae bacterium]|nr:hypothetical protein [Oscillospiraceae bacterium]
MAKASKGALSFLARMGMVCCGLGVVGSAVAAWWLALVFVVYGLLFYAGWRWLEGKR